MASTETTVVATPTSTVGPSEYKVNRLIASGGVSTITSTDAVSDPPTSGEMVTAFGSAVSVGSGFVGLIDSAGASTTLYLCCCDGANWHAIKIAASPKWHRTIHIPNPQAADQFTIEGFPEAATITKVRAEIQGGTSVTFNLRQRAEGSYLTATGESDVWTIDKVVLANASYTTFNDASLAADSILVYDASAVSGAVNDLVLLISGTYN